MFSPPSINHNNNHVDTLPQHTYATHKLPNFLDMIAAQHKTAAAAQDHNPTHTDPNQSNSIHSPSPCPSHSPNSNQIVPINYTMHNNHPTPAPAHKYLSIESNGDGSTYDDTEPMNYDEESMHAMDLSTTAAAATRIANTAAVAQSPIIIHGKKTPRHTGLQHPPNNTGNNVDVVVHEDGDNQEEVDVDVVVGSSSSVDESVQIGQYIAKNPNLTFKGTGDIMKMDIIFENCSIEEDTSIGAHSTNTTSTTTTDDSRAEDDGGGGGNIMQQVEHVNINGVHYQIITIENETITDEGHAPNITDDSPYVEAEEEIIDDSTISVIARSHPEHGIDDGTTTMMVMSNLDVAAEVEMGGESIDNEDIPNESTVIVTAPDASSTNIKVESSDIKLPSSAIVEPNDDDDEVPKALKNTPCQQPIETNAANDRRKRKRIAPVLASKRTRRNPAKNEIEQPQLNQSTSIDEEIVPSKLEYAVPQSPIDVNESSEYVETITDQPSAYEFQNEQYSDQACSQSFEDRKEDEEEQEEGNDDNDDDDDDDQEGEEPERSFLDSLVVVESQDPNEPNHTIHEVFVVDPDTNEMSEKPLDLPDHVIQRIRLAIS